MVILTLRSFDLSGARTSAFVVIAIRRLSTWHSTTENPRLQTSYPDTWQVRCRHWMTNTTLSPINPQSKPPNVVHPPGKHEEDSDATSLDVQQPLLYTASENGQLDIVRSLIDHSSDDNEKYDLRATALDAASKYGHFEVAKLLIERGVDVDSQSRDGWTRSLQRRDMDSLKSRGYCLT